MALIRKGAAWVAVAHSPAAGALSQVLEVGAIWRSIVTAESPAPRGVRNAGGGIGVEVVRAAITRTTAEMI